MKINITQEDIETRDPIKSSVKREHGLTVAVDNRFMIVVGTGHPTTPRRLPLSAELFMIDFNLGRLVSPFSFTI